MDGSLLTADPTIIISSINNGSRGKCQSTSWFSVSGGWCVVKWAPNCKFGTILLLLFPAVFPGCLVVTGSGEIGANVFLGR